MPTTDLPHELIPIKESILRTKKALISSQRKVIEQAKKQTVAEMCLQIAHDIRSPLPIIEKFSNSNLTNPTDDEKGLLKMAVKRISDIAENLLSKKDVLLGLDPVEKNEKVNLSIIIGDLIREKRITLLNPKIRIQFEEKKEQSYYSLCPKVFTRALSNIIQNSIESIDEEGSINIKLEDFIDKTIITIKDTGIGINTTDMAVIKNKGVSVGKIKGTGLGLSYAVEVIESLHGSIAIESAPKQGTQVQVSLPKLNNSKGQNHQYVLIDDEEVVRFNWEQSAKKHNQRLITYSSITDFYKDIDNISKSSIICIDSILGTDLRGEDAAEDIYNKGFHQIYLATGLNMNSLQKPKWIKKTIGKKPFWS